MGCALTVDLEDKKVVNVSGNTCPRGKVYAENECTNPVRTVTSIVATNTEKMLPVKTLKPIAKENVKKAMEIINKAVAVLPISVGDVIIEDVYGANVIATQNMQGDKK